MIDQTRCPLCGEANECAMAVRSEAPCWCAEIVIDPAVLDPVPEPARGVTCVCRACATRRRLASPT